MAEEKGFLDTAGDILLGGLGKYIDAEITESYQSVPPADVQYTKEPQEPLKQNGTVLSQVTSNPVVLAGSIGLALLAAVVLFKAVK